MRWTAALAVLAVAVGWCAAQPPPDGPKMCVYEPKATTKTVYATACKEYCAPDYSPLAVLRRCFGIGGCDGPCSDPLVKHVLVKKTVPGPDKMNCVLK